MIPEDNAREFMTKLRRLSQRSGIPLSTLVAVANQESKFEPSARGTSGEIGLMQILPATAKDIGGREEDLVKPWHNFVMGAKYLSDMKKRYGAKDTLDMLGGYNAGPGRIQGKKYAGIKSTDAYIRAIVQQKQLYDSDKRAFAADLVRLYNALEGGNGKAVAKAQEIPAEEPLRFAEVPGELPRTIPEERPAPAFAPPAPEQLPAVPPPEEAAEVSRPSAASFWARGLEAERKGWNALRKEGVEEVKKMDPVASFKVIGNTLLNPAFMGKQQAASVLRALQGWGGASVVDRGWADKLIASADKDVEEFAKKAAEQWKGKRFLPGISIEDLARLAPNLAYSTTTMGAALPVGVAAAQIPVVGTYAGYAAGMAMGGAVAYNQASYQIMQEYLEAKNDESIATRQRPITKKEENELRRGFANSARKYGLWEAGPEALAGGASVFAALARFTSVPIAARIAGKLASMYGGEIATETLTQMGQARVEAAAGLREEKLDWTSATDWLTALREVAPQTVLLTTFLGGMGAGAVEISRAIQQAKTDIPEGHPYKKNLDAKLDRDPSTIIQEIKMEQTVSGVETGQAVAPGEIGEGVTPAGRPAEEMPIAAETPEEIATEEAPPEAPVPEAAPTPTMVEPKAAQLKGVAQELAAAANTEIDYAKTLYRQVMDRGGIKPQPEEEFQTAVPNHWRRKNGLPADEMAAELASQEGYAFDTSDDMFQEILKAERTRKDAKANLAKGRRKYSAADFSEEAKQEIQTRFETQIAELVDQVDDRTRAALATSHDGDVILGVVGDVLGRPGDIEALGETYGAETVMEAIKAEIETRALIEQPEAGVPPAPEPTPPPAPEVAPPTPEAPQAERPAVPGELFAVPRGELTLERQDAATSDDQLEIHLQRKGWDLGRVRELQESIARKATPDMFTGQMEPLTAGELELQADVQEFLDMQRRPEAEPSAEAAPVKDVEALSALGFTDAQIERLTPDEAQRIVDERIRAEGATFRPDGTLEKPVSPSDRPSRSANAFAKDAAGAMKELAERAKRMLSDERGFIRIGIPNFRNASRSFLDFLDNFRSPQRDVMNDVWGAIEKHRAGEILAGLYASWGEETLKAMKVRRVRRELISRWIDDPATYQLDYDALPQEDKPMADVLKQDYAGLWSFANQEGVLQSWRENYINHIWLDSPDKVRRVLYPKGGRLGTGFQFARQRKIPTFSEGEALGLHPLLDPIKLNAIYKYQLYRTIANRNLIDTLKTLTREDGLPIIMGKPRDPAKLAIYNNEYKALNIPALDRYMYVGEAGGAKLFAKVPARADPDVAKALNQIFDPWVSRSNLNKAYRFLRSRVRRVVVLNPAIHSWNIFSDMLDEFNFNPYATMKAFKRGRDLYKSRDEEVEFAASVGVEMTTARAIGQNLRRAMMEQMPGYGLWKYPSKVEQFMDRQLWGKVVLWAQLGMFDQLMNVLAKQHPSWTREQVGRTAAVYVNTNLGTIPHTWMSRFAREAAGVALFAPRWTISNIVMLTEATSRGKLGMGMKALTVEERHAVGDRFAKHIIKGVIGLLAISNMVQIALLASVNAIRKRRDPAAPQIPLHTTFQNEKNHWYDIDTGIDDKRGQRIYLVSPLFRYIRDYFGYGTDAWNMEARTAYNKMETLLRQAGEQAFNYSVWQRQEIAKPGAPRYDRIKQRARYFVEAITPSAYYAQRPGRVKTKLEYFVPWTGTWIRRGAPGGRFTQLFFDYQREAGYEREKLDDKIDEHFQRGEFNEAMKLLPERYQSVQGMTNRITRFVNPLNSYWDGASKKEKIEFLAFLQKHGYELSDLDAALEAERMEIEMRPDEPEPRKEIYQPPPRELQKPGERLAFP